MRNKTLFIGATHGDEPIGVRALKNLAARRSDFNWMIGNPPAYERGVRFTQADLNRSAPGNVLSDVYEQRRAAELIGRSQLFDATIDVHGTVSNTGIFVIITNPTPENLALARQLNIERVVIWPAITPELKSPLSEFFPIGLEIECGPKNDPSVQAELERVLIQYLDGMSGAQQQTVYEVYGELRGDPGQPLQEFVACTVDGEVFTPLLIGQYTGSYGVTCYKLKHFLP